MKSQQRSGDVRGESPSYSLTGDQFSPMPQVVLMHCTVRVDEADIDQINQRDFTVHRTDSLFRESLSTACVWEEGLYRCGLQRKGLNMQD